MAPVDHLPFKWMFVAVTNPRDGSIRWKWQAFTYAGQLALESEQSFESLIDCMDNARGQGYVRNH
jgi:hypothetical protein